MQLKSLVVVCLTVTCVANTIWPRTDTSTNDKELPRAVSRILGNAFDETSDLVRRDSEEQELDIMERDDDDDDDSDDDSDDDNDDDGDSQHTNAGAIAGGVIGGLILLLLIIAIPWYWFRIRPRRMRRRRRDSRRNDKEDRYEFQGHPPAGKPFYNQPPTHPPPSFQESHISSPARTAAVTPPVDRQITPPAQKM
ncbi:hypothetical protein F5Y15DRAFT_306371 [Xylariaceae sp. FL0016]|nr:hypothetical protein F5Y15DRAFT_306371 [Xylariaceae sp. FL0016]